MKSDAGYGRKQHVAEALVRAVVAVEVLRATKIEFIKAFTKEYAYLQNGSRPLRPCLSTHWPPL